VAEVSQEKSGRNSTSIEDAAPSTLGVAISGGGVRAAFYGVGALLYIVHSGLNKKVKLISSVSGGSIGNTVIAMNCDYSQTDRALFDSLMSTMCNHLSRRGVFFLIFLRPSIVAFFCLGLSGAIGGAVYRFLTHPSDPYHVSGVILVCFVVISYGVIGGSICMLVLRDTFQIHVYSSFLKSLHRTTNRSEKRPKALADLPERKVTHVLCATELGSGQPFLMTRQSLVSPAFGKSWHTKTISVAKAVYASAAFPVLFPPLTVNSKDLDFAGGPEDELPKTLYLADGGVFNNLATDGLATLSTSAEQKYLVELIRDVVPVVHRNIVINASAPPSIRRIGLFTLNRTMSVMYESTLRPRIERLMEQEGTEDGPIVIDVAESPVELAERIKSRYPADDPVAKRANESIDYLGKIFTDAVWKKRANNAAKTKTALSAVGRQTAVRLVFLGYLNAAIGCNAHFGGAGVESVPALTWFGSLLDGDLPDVRGAGILEASLSGDKVDYGPT
jgi:predicted acylesterase/phospholipase RssA